MRCADSTPVLVSAHSADRKEEVLCLQSRCAEQLCSLSVSRRSSRLCARRCRRCRRNKRNQVCMDEPLSCFPGRGCKYSWTFLPCHVVFHHVFVAAARRPFRLYGQKTSQQYCWACCHRCLPERTGADRANYTLLLSLDA